MNQLIIVFLFILTYTTVTIGTAKYFYLLNIKTATNRFLKKKQENLMELHYSFEQIIYFYQLPSNISLIKHATQDQLTLKYDYSNVPFVQLNGIYLQIETGNDPIILAYLPIKNFMLPYLDEKRKDGEISESLITKISIAKLIHEKTLQEIKNEVYNQIQFGRYS